MPTITLSHDDCTDWRGYCKQQMEQGVADLMLLARFQRFYKALQLQETIGTLQVDAVLGLLSRISHGQLFTSALTPEDIALADRLAVCGLVETTCLGNAAIGFLSVKPRGTAVLEFLECWRSKYPWVVQN
jgi:hypothetical protein